jgi:hypothetical protein
MSQQVALQSPRLTFQYTAPMLIVYGRNGIGNSRFASTFKSPIFLDLDQNIFELLVDSNRSFDTNITKFQDVLDFLGRLINEDHPYETVVIDSLSSLERLIEAAVIQKKNVTSLGDFQFGQGHQMMMPLWEQFLIKIKTLRIEKAMTILMLGHPKEKKDPNLAGDSYLQYQVDLYDRAAKLLINSCSGVFLADYAVDVVYTKEEFGKETPKPRNAERRLFTNEKVKFIAKNTYGIPSDIPMTYDALREHVRDHFIEVKKSLRNREAQKQGQLILSKGEN